MTKTDDIWATRSPYVRLPPAPEKYGDHQVVDSDGSWLMYADPDPINPPPGVIDSRRRSTRSWRSWLWPRAMLMVVVARTDREIILGGGDDGQLVAKLINGVWRINDSNFGEATIDEALASRKMRAVIPLTSMQLMEASFRKLRPCEYCKDKPQTPVVVAGRRPCKKCLHAMGLTPEGRWFDMKKR